MVSPCPSGGSEPQALFAHSSMPRTTHNHGCPTRAVCHGVPHPSPGSKPQASRPGCVGGNLDRRSPWSDRCHQLTVQQYTPSPLPVRIPPMFIEVPVRSTPTAQHADPQIVGRASQRSIRSPGAPYGSRPGSPSRLGWVVTDIGSGARAVATHLLRHGVIEPYIHRKQQPFPVEATIVIPAKWQGCNLVRGRDVI